MKIGEMIAWKPWSINRCTTFRQWIMEMSKSLNQKIPVFRSLSRRRRPLLRSTTFGACWVPGVEHGLQPLGPVPFPSPQSKARPQRTTPTPSRQSPSMSQLKRQRSSTHRRSPPGTEMLPDKVPPERPATEMLLEKIRGSMQGLLERNWVAFSHHFPSGEVLDAKTIEVIQEENSRQRPIVIDFVSGSPQYALVLGSLDSVYLHCDVFHWKDAPAPLACKLCLSAGMERGGVRRRLRVAPISTRQIPCKMGSLRKSSGLGRQPRASRQCPGEAHQALPRYGEPGL